MGEWFKCQCKSVDPLNDSIIQDLKSIIWTISWEQVFGDQKKVEKLVGGYCSGTGRIWEEVVDQICDIIWKQRQTGFVKIKSKMREIWSEQHCEIYCLIPCLISYHWGQVTMPYSAW